VEEPLVGVADRRDLAVHGHRTAYDACAECLADGLMSETNAEEGDVGVGADEIDDAAGARRSARAGRDHDRARAAGQQRRRLEGVIAHDFDTFAGEALDLLD
jgi:hypothetical protein